MGIGILLSSGDGIDLSLVSAEPTDILKTKKFVNKEGELVDGSIPTISGSAIRAASSDTTVKAGNYLSGDITLPAVTFGNLSSGNIRYGTTITVYNGKENLQSVKGSYTEITASAATNSDIYSGKIAYVNGDEVKGSMPVESNQITLSFPTSTDANSYNPKSTIMKENPNAYFEKNIIINGISNLKPENIRSGVTIGNVKGEW